MEPFTYPAVPHVRRHGPQGYADPESYRPWLRDEFAFRCVFCLVREQWENPVGRFAVDHLRPKTRHPELATDYENLLYVCTSCNAVKGDQEVADPTRTLLATTVVVDDDGTLVGTTPQAAELLELLHLNYRTLRRRRRLLKTAIGVFREREPELYKRWMGFPDDLPVLSRLRPPGGNLRPEGLAQSHLARRQRGELPATYWSGQRTFGETAMEPPLPHGIDRFFGRGGEGARSAFPRKVRCPTRNLEDERERRFA